MDKNTLAFDRIAITGFALCNALGSETEDIWQATLAMRSGLKRITPGPDDPQDFFAPPFVPGRKSYCDVLGLCRPEITRQDVGLPPQDFQSLSASSKLTLFCGSKAVMASGLALAGYNPDRVAVLVSQNAGEAASTLWDLNLHLRAHTLASMAAAHGGWDAATTQSFAQSLREGRMSPDEGTMLCRLNCTAAGMLCLRYGFTGPSFSTGAACSSSMAALATAVHMLRTGSIDAALIGGGEEIYAPLYMAEFSALGALARPGGIMVEPQDFSRPFDRQRNGFVLGEGAAMLVLERESTARKRHAPLHGLITGLGNVTNSRGLIEPDAAAQAKAIRQSFAEVDYGPDAVDLVECHATSTVQGDLEEGRALAAVYGGSGTTVLSGYKGQIGHATGASGAMALIHGILSMRDGILPGTANYSQEDPAIPLRDAGLCVLSAPEQWKSPPSGIRRLQINSFAFGGACFALQVEEANERKSIANSRHNKSEAASQSPQQEQQQHQQEQQQSQESKVHFAGDERVENGVRFVTLSHTGQDWRLGTIVPNWKPELALLPPEPDAEALTALTRRGLWLAPAHKAPPVAVTCCGQGSMWPGMGRALYDTFPVARAAMDRIAAAASWDVLSLMDEKDVNKIILTRWQQPYLFLLEYAQSCYLSSLGFTPSVMSGHSLGELIALCLAGVYTPEQGWTILDTRSQYMGELEANTKRDMGMMAVHGPHAAVQEVLQAFPELHISNYNTPTQFILSGRRDHLTEARRFLRKKRVPAIMLNVSMAFHHPDMRVLRDISYNRLNSLEIMPARIPMFSNVTTKLYPSDREGISEHVVDLDENAVRWVECVRSMWNDYHVRHFVEFGPADTVSGLTSEICPQAVCVPVGRKDREVEGMRASVAYLYALGHIPQRTLHPVPDALNADVLENTAKPSFAQGNGPSEPQMAAQTSPNAKASTAKADTPPHVEDVMPLIMEATGYQRHELAPDMDLRHDLSIRSSRFPMIMSGAEERFQINMRFEDLVHVSTIRDLADVLARLRAQPVDTSEQEAPSQEALPNLESMPVWRYVPATAPLLLPAPPVISQGQYKADGGPVLLVGTGPLASHWHRLLTQTLNLQTPDDIIYLATADEALAHVQGALMPPRQLILALEDQDQDSSGLLITSTLLLQAFLANKEAKLCLVTESTSRQNHGTLPDSPLFAGLCGLLLSCALEYPKVIFRAVLAEAQLSSEASENWMRQALTLPSQDQGAATLPLIWHINSLGACTPRLEARPWDVATPGLPLRRGDVLLISGGTGGIVAPALHSLAATGCILILLGRRAKADATALQSLQNMGAEAHYMTCDITDQTAVGTTLEEILRRWGRVDGVLHCAGLNRDATLQCLQPQDVEEVMAVKCRGLRHLLEACAEHGLRYAAAFSSLAGWLGNYGQANYSAANRAMSAFLQQWCGTRHLPWRCVWLPPILGSGMASRDDMHEQLRLRGLSNACLNVEELGPLLARELLCGRAEQACWAREMPAVPTVLPTATPSLAATKGLSERPDIFPTVFPRRLLAGAQPTLEGGRHFSRFAKAAQWKQEQSHVPPALLLGSLQEAAHMAAPWLRCAGLDNVSFYWLPCPQGVTRVGRARVRWEEWITVPAEADLPMLLCSTDLEIQTISANGRQGEQWEQGASASALLSSAPAVPQALWTPGKTQQTDSNAHYLSRTVNAEEIAGNQVSRYNWPWLCLEVFIDVAMPMARTAPWLVERVRHIDALPQNVSLHFECRPRKGQEELLDGQVTLEDGGMVLSIEGLRLNKMRNKTQE